ncbi:MAG: hypothetical protein GQ579_02725 [Bacteroidales bacterium]|nr:hypothetical protein [Bacteroidales bacterium]
MILGLNLLLITQVLPQSSDSASVDQTRKEPRFHLSVSGIYAILETNVRFETLNGFLGLKIGMEDHLRLDKYRVMPLFSARIRIKNRHHIYGMYYNLPRKSSFLTEEEFEFEDQLIPAGIQVDSYFDLRALSVGYMYMLIQQERAGLGLFANFFMATADMGLSSDWEDLNETFRIVGILPNFGMLPYYRINNRFGFSGMISLFFMNLDDFGGSIHTVGAQFDAHLTRWLEMGIGYYLFDVSIEAVEPDFRGIFHYTYQGPFIGLGFRF